MSFNVQPIIRANPSIFVQFQCYENVAHKTARDGDRTASISTEKETSLRFLFKSSYIFRYWQGFEPLQISLPPWLGGRELDF